MKLTIIDRNPAHVQAAADAFGKDADVSVLLSDFAKIELDFDCLITPGNSFGIMDGGFDQVVKTMFGDAFERWVQRRIQMDHYGELNVGAALLLKTGTLPSPYVAYAPTMRVPMQITRTDNVYRAMRAALIEIRLHNEPDLFNPEKQMPIEHIVTPLLGAGVGHLAPQEAAKQMWLAWDSLKNDGPTITNLIEADKIQAAIGLGLGGDPENW